MNPHQFAKLVDFMQSWLDKNCKELDIYIGDNMAINMAKAAGAVVDACIESGRIREENEG
jgi:hypothetical protein